MSSRVTKLAAAYRQHLSVPWQTGLAAIQRVIFAVYDKADELRRYSTVIHLRTPQVGYNHQNPLRIESAEEAHAIDERIAQAWADHPNRVFIENAPDFMSKAHAALDAIVAALKESCHAELSIPSLP